MNRRLGGRGGMPMAAMSRALLALLASLILVAAAAPAAGAATTIDTTPGDAAICAWGYPDTATYGQTVTAPSGDNVLRSFSFYVRTEGTITYRAEVYAWDGTKATGSALFESPPRTVGPTGGEFEEVETVTGGVPLTPGQQYVLFLSVSKDYESNSRGDVGCMRFNESSAYGGGEFRGLNDSGDESRWTSFGWSGWEPGADLAFKATFSAPECRDASDNDGDGRTDYPDDPGCQSAEDDSESPDPPPARQCSDGRDNDSDGRTDYPRDPGCSSANDDNESNPPANPCTITGTSGNDVIRGTSGSDVICAGSGNDIVYGRGGNDVIYGGPGNDILRGGDGSDRLYGGSGQDVLRGGEGSDRLTGGPGNDLLHGDGGADSLNTQDGRRGNDVANGGAGDDSCATDRGDARSSC